MSESKSSDLPLTMGRLQGLSDCPDELFFIGVNPENLWKNYSVGIVGSRDVSEESIQAAFNYGAKMAKDGNIVVSGLAKGIDTAAFEGAISENGCCVAVLPSGLDEITPKSNIDLAKKIIESGGCLISEYPSETKPQKWRFLARNRIIAGLSDVVVIGEARSGGGAWNTIKHAWFLEKETFRLEQNGELIPVSSPQRRLSFE